MINKKELVKLIRPLKWKKDIANYKTFGEFKITYGFDWKSVVLNNTTIIIRVSDNQDIKQQVHKWRQRKILSAFNFKKELK